MKIHGDEIDNTLSKVDTEDWKAVCEDRDADYVEITKRRRVPGGWLYRVTVFTFNGESHKAALAMTFVPEPEDVERRQGPVI